MAAYRKTGPRTVLVGASQVTFCGKFPFCHSILEPQEITIVVTGANSHHPSNFGLSMEVREGGWGQGRVRVMVCKGGQLQGTHVDTVTHAQNPSERTIILHIDADGPK